MAISTIIQPTMMQPAAAADASASNLHGSNSTIFRGPNGAIAVSAAPRRLLQPLAHGLETQVAAALLGEGLDAALGPIRARV